MNRIDAVIRGNRYKDRYTTFSVRIPNDEADKVREYAADNGESVNSLLKRLLKKEIEYHRHATASL